MIIVRLMGGLGNQMFQYALGYSLANKFNTEFKLDDSLLKIESNDLTYVKRDFDLSIFKLSKLYFQGVEELSISKMKRYLNKMLPLKIKNYYIEEKFDYNKQINELQYNDLILEGYWQSFKYFDFCQKEIKESFEFSSNILDVSTTLQNDIISNNSVCLNVRRADFVSNSYHGTLDVDFYKKAIEKLNNVSMNATHKYFIFSDDINWCKTNLNFIDDAIFVEHIHKGLKFSNYLNLMTLCKHFIIPNSSFAWWAAWLSESKDKTVICPKTWFLGEPNNKTKDLIPLNWIRI